MPHYKGTFLTCEIQEKKYVILTDLGIHAFESPSESKTLTNSFGVEENSGKGKTGSRVSKVSNPRTVVGLSSKSDTVYKTRDVTKNLKTKANEKVSPEK